MEMCAPDDRAAWCEVPDQVNKNYFCICIRSIFTTKFLLFSDEQDILNSSVKLRDTNLIICSYVEGHQSADEFHDAENDNNNIEIDEQSSEDGDFDDPESPFKFENDRESEEETYSEPDFEGTAGEGVKMDQPPSQENISNNNCELLSSEIASTSESNVDERFTELKESSVDYQKPESKKEPEKEQNSSEKKTNLSDSEEGIENLEVGLPLEKILLFKMLFDLKKLELPELIQVEVSVVKNQSKLILSVKGERSQDVTLTVYILAAGWPNFKVKINPEHQGILRSEKGQSRVNEKLKSSGLLVIFYLKAESAHIIGTCDEDLQTASKILDDLVNKVIIPTSEDHDDVLKSSKWTEFLNKIKSTLLIELHLNSDEKEIVLLGFYEDVKQAQNSVEEFLKENTKVTRKIDLLSVQARLLKSHQSDLTAVVKTSR